MTSEHAHDVVRLEQGGKPFLPRAADKQFSNEEVYEADDSDIVRKVERDNGSVEWHQMTFVGGVPKYVQVVSDDDVVKGQP